MKKNTELIIGILLGIIISLIIFIVLLFTNNITINNSKEGNNEEQNLKPDIITEQAQEEDTIKTEEDITGEWSIYSIKLNNEEYNSRLLFGTCFANYGSKLVINGDNSYKLYIGCNPEETGTYILNDKKLTFNKSDGKVFNSTIEKENDSIIIKYHYPTQEEPDNLYLFFKRKIEPSS